MFYLLLLTVRHLSYIVFIMLYCLKCVKTGMQWTQAKQADFVHFLMDAILTVLLENSRPYTVWLGQRCVNWNVIEALFQ